MTKQNKYTIYSLLSNMQKNMFYEQNRNLEDADIGYETSLYTVDIYDKQYLISLGKERKLIEKQNYYYFPVYLMNNEYVQLQIGAFEYESRKETTEERLKLFKDAEGDLDISRLGDMIFYSFADREFFEEIKINVNRSNISELEDRIIQHNMDNKEENQIVIEDTEETPFDISDKDLQKDLTVLQNEQLLKDGIFTIDKSIKRPDMLSEETKEQSVLSKKEYRQKSSESWIEKYMRNNNYQIVETIQSNDSLYEAICLAYNQIGHKTTPVILKSLISSEVTESMFTEYNDIYSTTYGRKDTLEKEKRNLYNTNKELKKRVLNITDKPQKNELIKQANNIAIKYNETKEELDSVVQLLKEYFFMEGIVNIDQFHKIVQNSDFPVDHWIISILERKLNMKLILLSQEEYEEGDENNVLLCHKSINKPETEKTIHPDFYIIASLQKGHYDLATFKYKKILRFSELPYDIKILVVRKCMEQNAGEFNLIPEFRDFASTLGIKGGLVYDSEDDMNDDDKRIADSIDKSTVLVFYDKSIPQKVGKGPNEKLNINVQDQYYLLNLKKNKQWRKMLSDSWPVIFTIDQMKWQSVEHYYQGSKFKKHNPDFYKMFSLDSNSDFCKDVELAKFAGSKDGSYKKGTNIIQLRPQLIRVDPDFYGRRNSEEREKALYAKFSQNLDLKEVLMATKNATLKRFIPKEKPEIDCELMNIRRQLEIE
jgi:hypothetical protein